MMCAHSQTATRFPAGCNDSYASAGNETVSADETQIRSRSALKKTLQMQLMLSFRAVSWTLHVLHFGSTRRLSHTRKHMSETSHELGMTQTIYVIYEGNGKQQTAHLQMKR